MRTDPRVSWLFLILSIYMNINVVSVSGQCLSDQQSLLLQLKNTLIFNPTESKILVKWNRSSDCCTWDGVTCEEGRVVGLKLSNESISGGIENSTLFNLVHLKSLDLSLNEDLNSTIPSRIVNLTNLSYLNLSRTGFVGEIPKEISRLTKLVTLDFSSLLFSNNLVCPNLTMLVQNLTHLEELYFDGVDISAQKNEWGEALAFSSPNLRVFSLSQCQLSGPFAHSLSKLQSLSVIRLDYNNLSAPVPGFFANFSNLTSLRLSQCGLYGSFPKEIFQVPTLHTLDISSNKLLQISFPEFRRNSALQSLVASFTKFTGRLPTSIGNLRNLSTLELSLCQFNGTLPNSMSKLTKLVDLDLSSNNFSGPIPSFNLSKNLTKINLSSNRLTGPVTPAQCEGLVNLVSVNLGSNFLNGTIPSFLFAFPSLQSIDLSHNQFNGVLEFPNAPSSVLDTIDLSSNDLQGPIPMSIFKLTELSTLILSYNRFNGTIQFDIFQGLSNLNALDLSYNNLSVIISSKNANFSSFPKFIELGLASCKLGIFPNFLKNQLGLNALDLSDNQITGEIPNWIWQLGNGHILLLNLSHNHLVGLQEPYSLPRINILDLHSNQLRGNILNVLPPFALYIDLSSNYFTSSIPGDIGENFGRTIFFSLSNNSLTGAIPKSICNGSSLQVVDLSRNNLSGRIPACMPAMSQTLGINLGRNNLSGPIPNTFPSNCSLKTLDLNGNSLTGGIPKSLASCNELEILDLGNNQMFDSFPLLLKNISTLQVLVMRSNKFFGHITCSESIGAWPVIQIFDVASNNFSGELPRECLTKWHAMMHAKDGAQQILNHLRFQFTAYTQSQYYQNSVTVSNKGLEMELVKILTAFTSTDFSSNKFHGEIPKELGQLKSLLVLNLSNNVLSGQIPSSFGNLRELESLDLSRNNLNGTIPQTLSGLTFLSFLDLSYNHLVGRIPSGNQFQTFSADSFEGNEGLCGPPLTENCTDGKSPETSKEDRESNSGGIEIEWNPVNVGVGYMVGFGSVTGPLVFWRRWRNYYSNGIEDIAFRILPLPLLRKWISWKTGKRKGLRNRRRRAT